MSNSFGLRLMVRLVVWQGEDGKRIRTRAGESVKLKDLLNEAITRARAILEARAAEHTTPSSASVDMGKNSADMEAAARVIGIGAVKYADLRMHRESNYKFSFDKMLSLNGNTAPYLLYAYARVRSIQRKVQDTGRPAAGELADKPWNSVAHLTTPQERNLLVHLLRFEDVLYQISEDLLPNTVCDVE